MKALDCAFTSTDTNMNQIKVASRSQRESEIKRPLIDSGTDIQNTDTEIPLTCLSAAAQCPQSPLHRILSGKPVHSSNPELNRTENETSRGRERTGSRHSSIKSVNEIRHSERNSKPEAGKSTASLKETTKSKAGTHLKRPFKRHSESNMRISFAKSPFGSPSFKRRSKEKYVRPVDVQSPGTTSEEYCTYPNSPNSVLSVSKPSQETTGNTSDDYTSCNAESRSGSMAFSLQSLPAKLTKELAHLQNSQDSVSRESEKGKKGVQRTRSFRFPSFKKKRQSYEGSQPTVKLQIPGENFEEDLENSVYGTPKDELSPDQESTRAESVIKNAKEQLTSFFQPADNKLAMKLFGNEQAIKKERLRQQASGNWIIHPCSKFRFYWDFVMLCLLLANLIVLPIAISFFLNELNPKWVAFNVICDLFFVVDLIINFRTGIIQKNSADEIILNPRDIACHYLKTWFVVDLVSSVPVDYVVMLADPHNEAIQAGRAFRILRFAKLLSLLRFLRLSRLFRYVQQFEQFLGVAGMFMRIFHLVCLMLLLGHWSGCLQFLVPMLQEFPEDSWVAMNKLQDADWTVQYTWAFFKALSHMLCIGYGQIPPSNTTDAWLTIISMIIGATCYALLVGHATTLIQSFDTAKRLYRDKFKQVEEYMAYRKLPKDLRVRITDYYENRFQGRIFDEENILSELNDCLRQDVINYNCRELVSNVPFFNLSDASFVNDVVSKLKSEVYQPGDTIISEGEVGIKMYFIHQGQVEIVGSDGQVVTTLSDGSYFGEICLLTNERRVASVRAVGYCFVFSLHKKHFEKVLFTYPLMRRTMESIAAKRVTKLGKDASIVSTRKDLEYDLKTMEEIIKQNTPLVSEDDDSDVSEVEVEETKNTSNVGHQRKFSLSVPTVEFPFRRSLSPKRPTPPVTLGRRDEKDKDKKCDRVRKTSLLKALITQPDPELIAHPRSPERRYTVCSDPKLSMKNSVSDGFLSQTPCTNSAHKSLFPVRPQCDNTPNDGDDERDETDMRSHKRSQSPRNNDVSRNSATKNGDAFHNTHVPEPSSSAQFKSRDVYKLSPTSETSESEHPFDKESPV